MKRFSEQLNKKSQSVKMTKAERSDLKARLVSYMEYHPLPKTVAQKNAQAYIETETYFSINIVDRLKSYQARGFAAMFTVFMLVFVPIVAERAVPGDVLYPVKVNFNEEIRSTLSVSPYAKVEWETQRLERRISEARLLASEGKLTKEVEEAVVRAVEEHSEAAEAGIAVLRETDSDEAAIAEISFTSALSVQAEVLEGTVLKEVARSGNASSTAGSSVASLAGVVAQKQKEAEAKHANATPSYEKLMARIESESTRAYELFDSIKEVARADEVKDVERRLSDIERKLTEAVAIHTVAATERASSTGETPLSDIAVLRTTLSDLQKLISFMTDIDVREHVTVEALVPMTLTDEELTERIGTDIKQVTTDLDRITIIVGTRQSDAVTEKATFGIEKAEQFAERAQQALDGKDFENAAAYVAEALVITADIVDLLDASKELKTPTTSEVPASSTPSAIDAVGSSTIAVGDGENTAQSTGTSSPARASTTQREDR